MAKKTFPAWQQVLLTALNNVPKAKNGHDAWAKLNDEEQAAMMDFLTEHCGENAQAALEESCGKIKREKWWNTLWVGLAVLIFSVLVVAIWYWAEERLGKEITPYVWTALTLLNLSTTLRGEPFSQMIRIWKEHVATQYGTTLALNDMYRHYNLPRRERISKGMFILWLVMLVLWIGLIIWRHVR